MYKYEFVKLKLRTGFFKSGPKEDYHEIVKTYAENGWRLVQIFAPGTSSYGTASYFELIFEKEV